MEYSSPVSISTAALICEIFGHKYKKMEWSKDHYIFAHKTYNGTKESVSIKEYNKGIISPLIVEPEDRRIRQWVRYEEE